MTDEQRGMSTEDRAAVERAIRPQSDSLLRFVRTLRGRRAIGRARRVGRNDACPCGSGRKYKRCCGGNR